MEATKIQKKMAGMADLAKGAATVVVTTPTMFAVNQSESCTYLTINFFSVSLSRSTNHCEKKIGDY